MLKARSLSCHRQSGTGHRNFGKFLMAAGVFVLFSTIGFSQSAIQLTIADATELKIQTINAASAAPLYDPFQIWINNSNAYITDLANSTIKQISLPTGFATTLAGKEGQFGSVDGYGEAARFGKPAGIWSDDNYLYVSDAYFDTIRRIALTTGQVTTLAGSANSPSGSADGTGPAARFQSPNGVWGDGTNLYVCDSLNFTIRKIVLATGQVSTLAGKAEARGTADGRASARFYAPMAIWGSSHYLYVGDAGAIRKVTIATGEVATLAGNGSTSDYVDGSSTDARFGFISGIWGDGQNLFVADSGNAAIRKIVLSTGFVTTLTPSSGTTNGHSQQTKFSDPTGVGGFGTSLYVVDRLASAIWQATAASSTPTTTASVGPAVGPAVGPTGPLPGVPGTGTAPRTGSGTSGSTHSSKGPSSTPTAGFPGPGTATPTGEANPGRQSGLLTQLYFQLQNSGTTRFTSGLNETVNTGYAPLTVNCCVTPSGFAILDYRKGGVLLSEATVPVSQLVRSGRIATQIKSMVNTGIAIANPNAEQATINFYFTDEKGSKLYSGATDVAAGGLVTAFLNQPPFSPSSQSEINLASARTFTFSSSAPVGVTAIRGFNNERSDFLFATVPVVALSATESSPLVFAHYADGGGWRTQVELVNPTDSVLSGTVAFFGANFSAGTSSRVPRETVPYSVAPRSAVNIQPSKTSSDVRTGWIRVTPSSGTPSPSGAVVFSYEADGITTTGTAVAAVPPTSSSRLFVEASGNFDNGQPESVQTAFAIANPSEAPATVYFRLLGLDGKTIGDQTSLTIPPYEQVAMFLDQLPGAQGISGEFQGFIQITGSSVSVLSIRGRYNERGDFLITSTPTISESSASLSTKTLFPYLADGGGFTTEFLLFNRAASQESTGTVNFTDPSGSTLTLAIQ